MPDIMPDGTPWPKISIITPSYNQAAFIEETIRSVLLQGYPNLEYIIMDGGSSDHSVEIIKRYENYLACWVSERDRGQTDAINKGFAAASGRIMAWINSDDLYIRNAFKRVIRCMWDRGKIIRPVVYGDCDVINTEGRFQKQWLAGPVTTDRLVTFWRKGHFVPQPTVFMADYTLRDLSLDVSLQYAMDWDLFLRLSRQYTFFRIPECLARFRIYAGTKSSEGYMRFQSEQLKISRRYWKPGLQSLQYGLEYGLSPLTGILRRIPWYMRQCLIKFLPEQGYGTLKQIKQRLLPRRNCRIREEDRYL
ncbi:MAG: glycosyltransferase family 2 protein [bacterium]